MVTGQDIVLGLRELGLSSGNVVLVHSSLSSFGRVRGGAEAIVDAILEVLGSEGTLVVPTFCYTPEMFDPAKTASTVGLITETVRKRPNAVRSLHPTHSVAAIGPLAEELIKDHEKTDAFGPGSPLHKLLERSGNIMLIGVDHTTSSITHVAEELAGTPYLERVRRVTVAQRDGRPMTRIVRRPGCSRGFGRIAGRLEAAGAVRNKLIGRSFVQLMSAKSVVEVAVSMLQEDSTALLCERPDCQTCAEARAMVSAKETDENEKAIAVLLKEPVGENIRPLEFSIREEYINGENLN